MTYQATPNTTHPRLRDWLVTGPAGIVSHWASQPEAERAARERNGCAICGQRAPHLETCPKFGTEGLPVYYGEPDPEQD